AVLFTRSTAMSSGPPLPFATAFTQLQKGRSSKEEKSMPAEAAAAIDRAERFVRLSPFEASSKPKLMD
ncbi:hypothetical protein NE464_22580, partial [Eubacterium callanderi]|nr:hypothetical protein [Eubacterium callanderi]